MLDALPLPIPFAEHYRTWRDGGFADNAAGHLRLAEDGQHPKALVISCSDSRVNPLAMFGMAPGEIFVHRNVANLVPAEDAGPVHLATSAVVEYAVTVLKVPSVIIMGHSRCGGVAGCRSLCEGNAPALEDAGSSVGRWVKHLCPAYESVRDLPEDQRDGALERAGVLLSLENLMTFNYVAKAVETGDLTLHGLWTDIATGALEAYDPHQGRFIAI